MAVFTEWRCPYQFVGFSNSRTQWISGADATQAPELAIRVATVAFSELDEVQNGDVPPPSKRTRRLHHT